jgi:diguanylate cyclase (GGDEF)-like protein
MGHDLNLSAAAAALADAPLGILILDGAGRISWLNKALESLLGLDGREVLGRDAASVQSPWRERLFSPEPLLRLQAGSERPAHWLQTWTARGAAGTVHYYADITDLHAVQEERDRLYAELAQHDTRDAVTGLPNRQALLQGLEPLVSRSRRYQNPLSVIRLRLDNLRDLDAEHGKPSGEKALIAVAQMLKDQLRWADLIGRFDNDEFLLVLPETDAGAADRLMDKLHRHLAGLKPAGADGRELRLLAQFGTASWQPGDDRAKLLRRAREQLEGKDD